MGLVTVDIMVGNPANPERLVEVECLVDSGAIYSIVPQRILEELGIKPISENEFRLANGEKITRKKGVAIFKMGERIGGADVIFGEEGDSVLLGAMTLEALGLALDPIRRELKPMPMVLGGPMGKGSG